MNFGHEGLDLDPKEAEGCCAWTKWVYLTGFQNLPESYCGHETKKGLNGGFKAECCGANKDKKFVDCDHIYNPIGVGHEDMMDFLKSEEMWLKYFARAWHMATENGM